MIPQTLLHRFQNPRPPHFPISHGSRADYARLAHLHYRAGPPATFARVLRMSDPHYDALVGVLVVSMPVLNARWRSAPFPALFDSPHKRLNALLRTISRVVIDPRYRALGCATALVRAYLHNPLTPHTEALAAMGAASPFFAAAGMTPFPVPPSRTDLRLLSTLRALRIHPRTLAHPAAPALLSKNPPLARALRTWAASSGRARLHRLDTPRLLLCAASLAHPLTAYAFSRARKPRDPCLRNPVFQRFSSVL